MPFLQLVKSIRFCRWLRPLIISQNLLLSPIQDSQTAWNFFHCTKSSGTSTNNSPTIKESFQSVKYSFLKIPPYNSLFYEINISPRNIKSFINRNIGLKLTGQEKKFFQTTNVLFLGDF